MSNTNLHWHLCDCDECLNPPELDAVTSKRWPDAGMLAENAKFGRPRKVRDPGGGRGVAALRTPMRRAANGRFWP